MNRRQILSAAALAPLFATSGFWAVAHAQGAAAGKRHKLVIQVSDNDLAKWNLALNNARNVQDDLGAANVELEIVAYGPGIGMLKMEAPVAARVSDAAKAGVKIIACENTMRGQKLAKEDMNASVSYVQAGVTEIMRKQGEGWAYLRP